MPARQKTLSVLPHLLLRMPRAELQRRKRHLFRVRDAAHAAEHVRDVLPDLVRRLQPEQVEVAQEVVVDGQELQVELRQRQACLACA